MMVALLLSVGLLVSLTTTCHAQVLALRDQVARRWAPTLFQETRDSARDQIAALDFDGDWDASNNAAHIGQFPLRAVLYYSVVETATHWFVQYMPYHPIDYKLTTGHAHDTESVLLVVAKRGPLGTPEAMETRFHTVWYQYAAAGAPVADGADDIDGMIHVDGEGRPMVYSQRVGHGLCGGFAPLVAFADLQITCDHARRPALEQAGVVYHYTGQAGTVVAGVDKQYVGYELVELSSTWWAHARSHQTFSYFRDYHGERCASSGWDCPRDVGGAVAGDADACATPWSQSPGRGVSSVGDTFFDPAFTMSRRLHWRAPFALDYAWNPFVGIGTRIAMQP